MQTAQQITKLRSAVVEWRKDAESIALVPTMGNLHAGHIALVNRARQIADHTIVSIFVNPMQFAKGEDFDTYPRTPDADLLKLSEAGVDLVFIPHAAELYADGMELATRVEVPALDNILCGAFRPGHFTGVATIVAKLFNLTQPDIAIFGDKDFQQLQLIRRMVEDLCMPVDIVAVPTVRERDGLALSSRNSYLSAAERKKAPVLFKTLKKAADEIRRGNRKFPALELQSTEALAGEGFRPEYFSIRRADDLSLPAGGNANVNADLVILAAAWLGRTRLIDHIEIKPGR
jgi:pantoate--beta-alanine ligase